MAAQEPNRRILIVDDDELFLKGLRRTLSQHYAVETALGANAALERMQDEGTYSVVVSDMQMPEMDGVELLSRVREASPHSMRIMLTGKADLRVAMTAVNTGAVFKFLCKPCAPDELRAVIDEAIVAHEEAVEKTAMATDDPLLSIKNRRSFEVAIESVHQKARDQGRSYGVAIADVDCFKKYNDHYGHLAGDEALIAVAQAMEACCRGADGVFRYGGEEFALILQDVTADGLRVACDRFRASVEALGREHVESPSGLVTVSIGAELVQPGDAREWQACLQSADEALYEAKENGRNRAVVRAA